MSIKFLKFFVLILLTYLQNLGYSVADTYVWKPDSLNNPRLSDIEKNPDEISLNGQRIYKFQIQHGACSGTDYFDDCSNDRQRVELSSGYNVSLQNFGTKPKEVKRYYRTNLYIPSEREFPETGEMQQTLHQVKLHQKNMPVWMVSFFHGGLKVEIESGEQCFISPKFLPRNEWLEIEIFADYSLATAVENVKEHEFFIYSINGQTLCSFKRPLITKRALDDASRKTIVFKFGIYNTFVSKWLLSQPENRLWVEKNNLKFSHYKQDLRGQSGGAVESELGTPFKYDWPIKLPTQTIYVSEWVISQTRDGLGTSRFSVKKARERSIQERLRSEPDFENCVITKATQEGLSPDRIKKAINKAKRGLSKPLENIEALLKESGCN